MKKKKLKIAMFCTNKISTPLKGKTIYAPVMVTNQLVEGMIKKGHDVTLFATKGSKTKARLIHCGLNPLESKKVLFNLFEKEKVETDRFFEKVLHSYETIAISKIYQMAQKEKFDVIHIHPSDRALPLAPLVSTPTIFTLHDPIAPWRKFIYSAYKNIPQIYYVSISDIQRKPLKNLNYINTIYNGLDLEKYPFNEKPKESFICAGRITQEKGIHTAIQGAKKAKVKLSIIGFAKKEEDYWQKKIKPYLDKNIKYKGMVPLSEVFEFYQNSKALLFPIQWEEPFGLVMIEAMACGTPVIAFNRGAVPEVVKDGKTGFIIPQFDKNKKVNIKGLVEAIKKIDQIDRKECRKHVEENFTIKKMVDNYEKVYYKVIKDWRRKNGK